MTLAARTQPVLDAAALNGFLQQAFPELSEGGGSFTVETVAPLACRMRMAYHPRHLRPGGTISGPAIFALADVSLYVATLAHIGIVPLAVTANLTINFLRKPPPGDLLGQCRLLKLGRRLSVGEVLITSAGDEAELVAHASGTYAIPDPIGVAP